MVDMEKSESQKVTGIKSGTVWLTNPPLSAQPCAAKSQLFASPPLHFHFFAPSPHPVPMGGWISLVTDEWSDEVTAEDVLFRHSQWPVL